MQYMAGICGINSCSLFNVAVCLLEASLIFMFDFSSVLEKYPVLTNVTFVPYFLHVGTR